MPLFDFRCGCGRTFEALMSFAALQALKTQHCPDCGQPTRRLPSAGAGLLGTASIPPGPDAAPTSWNGTHQGDREYVTHWRRALDARARLETKHPELGRAGSPVLAHEGRYAAAPLTLSEMTRGTAPDQTGAFAVGSRDAVPDSPAQGSHGPAGPRDVDRGQQ